MVSCAARIICISRVLGVLREREKEQTRYGHAANGRHVEIMAEIVSAHEKGQDVARVHSGDPSLYGAIAEQIRRLRTLGIPYTIDYIKRFGFKPEDLPANLSLALGTATLTISEMR